MSSLKSKISSNSKVFTGNRKRYLIYSILPAAVYLALNFILNAIISIKAAIYLSLFYITYLVFLSLIYNYKTYYFIIDENTLEIRKFFFNKSKNIIALNEIFSIDIYKQKLILFMKNGENITLNLATFQKAHVIHFTQEFIKLGFVVDYKENIFEK